MSQALKALINANSLGLPDDEVNTLMKRFESRSISFLTAEKEMGPFLLYACGDSLQAISIKTGIPLDILRLTAMNYHWVEKMGSLGIATQERGVEWVSRDLANTFLVASSIVIKRKLGELIAGKTASDTSKLIPGDIYALDKMLRLIHELYKTADSARTTNVIHADNVQVVNNADPEQTKKKLDLLKELEMEK